MELIDDYRMVLKGSQQLLDKCISSYPHAMRAPPPAQPPLSL
jgi:hypothetical protein